MTTLVTAPPDRFRVLGPLSSGAISRVFVAHDEELNRTVALKRLRARYADCPSARSRLAFEAEVTAGLEHPGVVPVYGQGETANGRAFFAMRLIRGDHLLAAIEQTHALADPAERAAKVRRLLDRLLDVCYTLGHVHDRGVIHRDLSPRNIMLGAYGETLIVDWGLAKVLRRTEDEEGVAWPATGRDAHGTKLGRFVGTPRFTCPEQARGEIDRHGPACDVFALGAVLATILTGRPPYDGPTDDDVLALARDGAIARPGDLLPGLDPTLDAICLKAMAREPEDRFEGALALGEALERWLSETTDSIIPSEREAIRTASCAGIESQADAIWV